jgi:dipeptidyl aminopeptidase/acylaminoacyl peptidase
MKLFRVSILLVCCSAGCIPVDLEVNSKGEMIIPREDGFFRFHPGTGQVTQIQGGPPGQPVGARFNPSGTEVLLVAKGRDEKTFEDSFRCDLLPLGGGKGRTVYKAANVGNLQFSPDGTQLAVVRYENDEAQLLVVDVKSGEARLLLKKVGHFVRWFTDSKRLVVFRVESKKDSVFRGEIATCEAVNGKLTSLAALLARKESTLDLSPDNRKILFSANQAGPAGSQLTPDEERRTNLFELDVAGREVRSLSTQAGYVRYSPGGKKVLLTRRSENHSLGTSQELVVADAALGSFKAIASDSFTPIISFSMDAECFPGWLDEERLFYFTERMVFGLDGKALHLVLIGADGSNKKFVQPALDEGVEKAKAAAKPLDPMK